MTATAEQRIVAAADLPAEVIAPLFEACFGQPFDAAWWRWKYRAPRNPSLALVEDGRAMAHYGGMPRALSMFGEPVAGLQVGDVMVHPQARGGLGRRGPFYRLASTFLGHEVGYGLPALLAFGFPNLRALRLGEALGLYAAVDTVTELRWPATPHQVPRPRRIDAADTGTAALIDRAWVQMQADLGAMLAGVRDAMWWSARYAGHPAAPYATWLIEQPEPALLVLRAHGQALEWIDFIGPLASLAAARDAARALAGAGAHGEVFAWLSSSAAARVRDAAAVERNIEVGVPTCAYTPGPAAETLRGRWWLMGGDADFR